MTGRLWRTSMAVVWLLASALEPVRAEEPPPPRPTSGFPASGIAANAIRLGGVTGRTGAILFDLHTGKVLDEVAADEAFPPASTIKIATVARALEILGPRYRFETRLLTNGKIIGSVLEGDLYLQGTGDPTLDTVDLADMLRQFRLMGVSEVRGQLLYDDSLLPRGSGIDDQQQDHVVSNPGYGGLNLNFNRVWLDGFRSGEGFDAHMLARADGRTVETDSIRLRYLPDVNFPLLRHRFEGREEIWEADFRTLAAVPKRWLPVRAPGAYAASVFRRLAAETNILLPEARRMRVPEGATVLVRHQSQILARLAAQVLLYSNNLAAEVLGLATAVGEGQMPDGLADSARGLTEWIGGDAPEGTVVAYNHSGLGDGLRITPNVFRELLARLVLEEKHRGDIRSYLPVRTTVVSDTGIRADMILHAKSGTLHYVRALAGYIRDHEDDRELGFAIFSADLVRRKAVSQLLDRPIPQLRLRPPIEWHLRTVRLEKQILKNWVDAFVEAP